MKNKIYLYYYAGYLRSTKLAVIPLAILIRSCSYCMKMMMLPFVLRLEALYHIVIEARDNDRPVDSF